MIILGTAIHLAHMSTSIKSTQNVPTSTNRTGKINLN